MNSFNFIACESDYNSSNIVLFGAGMDTTTTNRPGTRFAPNAARNESYGLETYSPYLDKDLEDMKICDYGDIELTFGNASKQMDEIHNVVKQIVADNKIPFMIGGEHLVSYPAIKAVCDKYQDVSVIHFDAHTDLRTDYMGEKFSHSTVMYHVNNLDNINKIYQFGIRSGTKEEFEYASNNTYIEKFDVSTVGNIVSEIEKENVYISIDLDVLDPSILSGTGTPEPGGISFKGMIDATIELSKLKNIVGIDVVELSPMLDPSGVSNAVCAKVIRELLLIMGGK